MEEHNALNKPTQKRQKRKSGGQPGNQNAVKHGFYSSFLTGAERLKLKEASEITGTGHELAMIRAKMGTMLSYPDLTLRQLATALNAITRAELAQLKIMAAKDKNEEHNERLENIVCSIGAALGLEEYAEYAEGDGFRPRPEGGLGVSRPS